MKLKQPFRSDPSATSAFVALNNSIPEVEKKRRSQHPLRAVVIGGGTGSPMSIRTLLSLGRETSAVVAMADDGGSPGILRDEADVTPPGDIRKCIVAFAEDPNDPIVRVLKYRFAVARDHALGNLMLSALEDACQSFPEAISICERLVNAKGHVYPSTLDHVTISAHTRDGGYIDGQAQACHSQTALEHVVLQKTGGGDIKAYEPALEAIRNADLIVLGPGSLFTSIIPNLLVPGVVEAIRASRGRVVFVCALADVQGETWGLTAREHFEALADHGMRGLIDYMLVHSDTPLKPEAPADEMFKNEVGEAPTDIKAHDEGIKRTKIKRVHISYKDLCAIQAQGPVVIARNLADDEHPTWHSPFALRQAFSDILRMMNPKRK
ncbi:MAG: YvcK family protein [Eggerthellaceae bacterium]|nr:YvcK family protein [Eggerthellaceae bacterium]